jgi:cell wall integrity and stress response component
MTRLLFKIGSLAPLLTLLTTAVNAQSATVAAAGAIQTLECYSSAGNLKSLGDYTFQTSGYCQKLCVAQDQAVMATTGGSTCLCGNQLPPASAKVDSSKCDEPCDGYDQESCGGQGYFQLYLSGLGDPSGISGTSTSGDSSSSTSATPSVVTQTKAGQTIVVTQSASAGSSSGGSSKVGIAVGVVVGILVIAGIIGGTILYLKRRRNKAIEEEHRRNAAVSSFVSGGKSETSSNTDQRLDPTAFSHRRESIGSIADERDFSRRILQVS